ncbi:hypothetical protein HY641_01730 [Candidatus Woesearchaeota archaeon]|nr:hypothetical protein [Candidatus Woesearchaeota archaeon]
MNKIILVIAVFLIMGGLMIKYDVDKNGGEFSARYFGWVKRLGGNVQSVTSHVVTDYTWLPALNDSTFK